MALDNLLGEIHISIETVERYSDNLHQSRTRSEQLDKELFGVAERLATLRERVGQASFKDKRRAVVELVKGVQIASEKVDRENAAMAMITYRFDQVPGVLQGRGTLVPEETLRPFMHMAIGQFPYRFIGRYERAVWLSVSALLSGSGYSIVGVSKLDLLWKQ